MHNVKPRLAALAGLSALNVGFGIYLSKHFFELREGTSALHSMCNVGEAANCDVVAASPHAELMSGLPLSGFVAGWYLAALVLSLLAFHPARRRPAVVVLGLQAALATALSVYYTGVMVLSLRTLCLFCLAITALDFFAFFLALGLAPGRAWAGLRAEPAERARLWPMLAFVAAAALITPLTARALFLARSRMDPAKVEEVVQRVLASPAQAPRIDSAVPFFGAADAPVTIVEFSDFQCPFCRRGAKVMHALLSRYPGKVKLVFKHYPLDPACNHAMKKPMHPFACEAARAGYCAHQQGKFRPAYERIFEGQDRFAPGVPAALAAEAGADPARLAECMSGFQTNLAILADIDEAERLGIAQSAPVFFVNGHMLSGAYPLVVWERIVEALLAPTR